MKNNIFANLNDPQKQAVQHKTGPALVIAGAGSGKTRVLTHRVAFLISEGVKPENILAITFTNKAAREMMERIGKLLEMTLTKKFPGASFMGSGIPHVGTFHSIGARILRQEAKKVKRTRSFAIYDEDDQRKLIRILMREQEISEEQFPVVRIQDFISRAKSELIDSTHFLEEPENYFEEKAGKIYSSYQNSLVEHNAFDFDDLIMVPVKLLQDNEEIKKYYQSQFQHILVDEYQDTNHAQYQFIKTLGEDHRNVFVVGDDFQSIYGWRGADLRNIFSFEKDYPEAEVILLEQNYRSTQNILDSAHEIISKNPKQKKKKLWTENKQGDKVYLYEAEDQEDEARFIIGEIQNARDKYPNLALGDFAVLYRTNAQSRALEERFLEAGLPYHLVGALRFYSRKEIKDLLAYFRVLVNPRDEMSLRRIYNVPRRKLGKKSWKAMKKIAERENKRIGEILADSKKFQAILEEDSFLAKWEKLGLLLQALKDYMKKHTLSETLEKLIEGIGYAAYLEEAEILGGERLENVKELFTVTEKYDKDGFAGDVLEKFLEEVGLLSADDRESQDLSKKVQLMTMHSAKGLEFKTVFLVGMEEGLFPHSRSLINPKEMEEERRLCYVGITRAKKRVYLVRARRRHLFGSLQANPPSRFLREIPEELIEIVPSSQFSVPSQTKKNHSLGTGHWALGTDSEEDSIRLSVTVSNGEPSMKSSEKIVLKDGDSVYHASFGKGVIISQDDTIVTVAFAGAGVKKLDKSIAPIKRLNEKKSKRPIV